LLRMGKGTYIGSIKKMGIMQVE